MNTEFITKHIHVPSTFLTWTKAIVAAFVTGASSAGISFAGVATADAVGANVPQLNLKQLGIMMLSGGVVGALAYLKTKPVPNGESDTDEKKSGS